MCTHGRILRYTKYGLRTKQIKMIGQRKTRRNAPYKWFKLPWGHDSGTLHESCPCVYPHILYSFSHLINTLLASLLSIFVETLFCKVKGPGPLSLTLVLWLGSGIFTTVTQPQSLAGNPSPTPSSYRPRLPEIILTTNWKYSEKNSRRFQKAKLEFALP